MGKSLRPKKASRRKDKWHQQANNQKYTWLLWIDFISDNAEDRKEEEGKVSQKRANS